MDMKCKLLQARQIPIKFNNYKKNQMSNNCSRRGHTYIYTHVNLLHNLR